jgi:gluconokinase
MSKPPLSAYQETLGMIYFARMLDKIRLNSLGELAEDFQANLGGGFDERCVDYLRVPYPELQHRTLQGGSDEDILQWCFETGRELSEGDILIWNQFLSKRGWNDEVSGILAHRKKESGLETRDEIQTMAEYFEYDEGRKS